MYMVLINSLDYVGCKCQCPTHMLAKDNLNHVYLWVIHSWVLSDHILSINTLDWNLDQCPDQYSVDTLSTLDQQSVDSQSSVYKNQSKYWTTLNQDANACVERVLIKLGQSRLLIEGTDRHSTMDAVSTRDVIIFVRHALHTCGITYLK